MKRSIAILAILFFAAAFSFAQDTHWQILRAEYGSGGTWTDVTQRVLSLATGDSLTMRVDNATLGSDPVPGAKKTLRLRLRDDYGREEIRTYAEKETFSLRLRSNTSAYPGGNSAPYPNAPASPPSNGGYGYATLQILRADYGADSRFSNVTSRLASQIQNNALTLTVSNSTMGGDPAEERHKTLTVWYVYNGRVGNVVVNEHDTLSLPSDVGFFSGRLRVMRAQYGVGHRFADVTDTLNSQIQTDQLSMRITNDTMGGDPDPNQRKQLIVFYVYNGRPARAIVNEKATLTLPTGDVAISSYSGYGYGDDRIEILEASYGAGDTRVDVTSLIASQMHGNSLQLVVSNASMGGDPAPGQKKRLRVLYLWQGMRNLTTVGEGETFMIP